MAQLRRRRRQAVGVPEGESPVRLQCYLPAGLLERAEELAVLLEVPRAVVLRRAVASWTRREGERVVPPLLLGRHGCRRLNVDLGARDLERLRVEADGLGRPVADLVRAALAWYCWDHRALLGR